MTQDSPYTCDRCPRPGSMVVTYQFDAGPIVSEQQCTHHLQEALSFPTVYIKQAVHIDDR